MKSLVAVSKDQTKGNNPVGRLKGLMKKIAVSPRVKRTPLKPADTNKTHIQSPLANCNEDMKSESTEEACQNESSKTNLSPGKENASPRSKKLKRVVNKLISPLFKKSDDLGLVNKTSPAKDNVTSRRSIFGKLTNKNNKSMFKNEELQSFVTNDWLDFKQSDFDQF